MSALSFVALELQTTHLDPASVSQASYVKIVNGNITRTDALSITPPTLNDDLDSTSAETSLTWAQALSQLTMMVGQLPVVSYYRDADKEVFQAASRHIEATPPDLHWLDCRELARKYLPDLPEFQLSTVLKSLDLYDEYADSDSVEQTTQIVFELARQHEATSVEELWGELYDQPDKLLGLGAGVEAAGLSYSVGGLDEPNETFASDPDAEIADSETVEFGNDDNVASKVDAPDLEGSETLAQAAVEEHEQQDGVAPDEAMEEAAVTAKAQELTESSVNFESFVEDDEPQVFGTDQEPQDPALADSTEQQLVPEELVEAPIELDHDAGFADEQSITTTATEDAVSQDQIKEYSDLKSSHREPTDVLDPSEASVAPTIGSVEIAQAEEHPVELAETATAVSQTASTAKQSPTLRTLGFIGLFGFGLLTIVGIVLTIMAVMLFFTDNALLLETKIAGVVLTAAVTLLSLLMTTISYQSFRKY